MNYDEPTTYFDRCYILVSGLQRLGWSYQQACAALDLPIEKPTTEFKLPLSQYINLCERINVLLEDDVACFRLGFNTYPADLGHVIKLCSYAQTQGHAIQYSLYFQCLFNTLFESNLVTENGYTAVIHSQIAFKGEQLTDSVSSEIFSQEFKQGFNLLEEFRLSMSVQQIYFSLGGRYHHKEIFKCLTFRHNPNADIADYQKASPVNVLFNQPKTGLFLQPNSLTLPIYSHDQDAFEYQLTHIWRIILECEKDLSIVEILRYYCLTHIPAIEPNIEIFSKEIGRRESHINQQLLDAGYNFQRYVRTIKNEIARCHLQTTQATISEISRYLGYSSVNNFSQSFKLHFAITPSQYRKKVQLEGGL